MTDTSKPRGRPKKFNLADESTWPDAGWFICGAQSYGGYAPPSQSITVAGISFPLYAYDENPTVKDDTVQYDQRREGQRQYLMKEDLRQLKRALTKQDRKVVKPLMGGKSFRVLRAGAKLAQDPQNPAIPLHKFLYIHPADAPKTGDPRLRKEEFVITGSNVKAGDELDLD